MSPLADRFPTELDALSKLFGSDHVESRLPRLDEVFQYTEKTWLEYVELIPRKQVKYLLIAEAPPWKAEGDPPYVLDPKSRPRTLLRALCGAFFGEAIYKRCGSSVTLAMLAERGFLIADSTPFAVDYRSVRSRHGYRRLMALTTESYMQAKLDSSRISCSSELRIAFSVQRNAIAAIAGLGTLHLDGNRFKLSPEMIAVNRAGYPDAARLRQLYHLSMG